MASGYLKILVLKELNQSPMTGYDLMNSIESSQGKRPSAGSMYPLLKILLERKLIKGVEKNRKTIYSITVSGKNRIEEIIKEKSFLLKKGSELIKKINKTCGCKVKLPFLSKKEDQNIIPHFTSSIHKLISVLTKKDESKLSIEQKKDTDKILTETKKKLQKVIK